MFNNLTALAVGIVGFAIAIGVGVVVLGKFGDSVASCPTGYTYQANGSGTTYTTGYCCTNLGNCASAGNYTSPSVGTTNINYLGTQLGTSGLAGWTGAVIALVIGLMFLGAFIGKRNKGA